MHAQSAEGRNLVKRKTKTGKGRDKRHTRNIMGGQKRLDAIYTTATMEVVVLPSFFTKTYIHIKSLHKIPYKTHKKWRFVICSS